MGYCYYGNYAQYFEVGRVEALRELGMSYKKLEEMGYMLPVSSYGVEYLYPAKYDDLLSIETRVIDLKGVRLYFEYTITNASNQIVATAKTLLVFVNKDTMKPVSPPDSFTNLFQ